MNIQYPTIPRRVRMIQIYNENCFDTMERIGEDAVDCVITSPPYNISHRSDYNLYDDYTDD